MKTELRLMLVRVSLTFLFVVCVVSGFRTDAGAEERQQGELSHLLSIRWNRETQKLSQNSELIHISEDRKKNQPEKHRKHRFYLQESSCCCCCYFLSKTLWWGRVCSWGQRQTRTHESIYCFTCRGNAELKQQFSGSCLPCNAAQVVACWSTSHRNLSSSWRDKRSQTNLEENLPGKTELRSQKASSGLCQKLRGT